MDRRSCIRRRRIGFDDLDREVVQCKGRRWNASALPIKNFIVLGPYRYVRNPMLIGVNLFLVAEAILLHSLPIFIWMVAFVIINTVYFALSEEPQLEKRFGEDYVDYKRNVPRWIPRLSPYEPTR